MSSFLCFICHSTVHSDSDEETREKYREVVGMHLCPDALLCHICCHVLNKLWLFRHVCLKRSLEYPVLFREKGTLNLQRNDLEIHTLCPIDQCGQHHNRNVNSKSYNFVFNDNHNTDERYDDETNDYVNMINDRDIYNDYLGNEVVNNKEFYSENVVNDHYNDQSVNNVSCTDINVNLNIAGTLCASQTNLHDDNEENSADNNRNEEDYVIRENTNLCSLENPFANIIENNETEINERNELICEDTPSNLDDRVTNYDEKLVEYEDNELKNYDSLVSNQNIQFVDDEANQIKVSLVSNQNIQFVDDEANQIKVKKKKSKGKKSKKDGFDKIVLSLEEQKAELEARRKEKKYIEAEFKCYNCALGFLFKDTYQAHMMRHEESNGEYLCAVCTLRFATRTLLRLHGATAHAQRRRCRACGARVPPRREAAHRARCAHPRPEPHRDAGGGAACHLCARIFRDGSGLQQHLKRFHQTKTSNRTYSCSVCGKSYNNQSAVRTHMIKHINRKFDCDMCSSTFSSPYTLTQHKKKHTVDSGDTQHYCHICKVGYSTRKSLLAHLRNSANHQQTMLECGVCGRACPGRRALSAHAQAAHGAGASRPHACASCPARYATRKSLVRHARAHLAARAARPAPAPAPAPAAVCHLCGNCYAGNNKLNRHLREVCEKAKLEEQLSSLYEQ